jgi:hypothetical protein
MKLYAEKYAQCKLTRKLPKQIQYMRTLTYHTANKGWRGEFRSRQTRQLPRAVDLKGRFLFFVVVKC